MTQRYDQTGRPMMAMLWEAIANIPDRVNEVAALVDPNALRYVGWNDVSNQLELLAFDAADIPYDNGVSGLTAVEVKAAIDELAAAIGAGSVGTIYSGFVSSTGTTVTSELPAGWTVSRPATGRYRIVHSLGLADVDLFNMCVTQLNVYTADRDAIEGRLANQLDVRFFNDATGFLNLAFSFIAVDRS